jgi:hypothetical protein
MTDAISELEHRRALGRARAKRFYEAHKIEVLEKQKQIRVDALAFRNRENPPDDNGGVGDDSHPLAENDYNYAVVSEDGESTIYPNRKRVIKKRKDGTIVSMPKVPNSLPLEYCVERAKQLTNNDGTTDLKKTTNDKYVSNVRMYFKRSGEKDLLRVLNNPELLENIILKMDYSIVTSRDIITMILKLLNLKIYPNYPKAKYDVIQALYLRYNTKTDSDRKNRTTDDEYATEDMNQLTKLILDKFGENSKQYLLISIYNDAPKRDDLHMRVIASGNDIKSKNENYIIVPTTDSCKLYIQEHKTSGKYKTVIEPLSVKTSTLVRSYMKSNKLKPGDFLFKELKLGPFIKKMFAAVKKPKINGVNALRHSIISTQLNRKDITIEEATKLANTMKHSSATQATYLRKIKQ